MSSSETTFEPDDSYELEIDDGTSEIETKKRHRWTEEEKAAALAAKAAKKPRKKNMPCGCSLCGEHQPRKEIIPRRRAKTKQEVTKVDKVMEQTTTEQTTKQEVKEPEPTKQTTTTQEIPLLSTAIDRNSRFKGLTIVKRR